MKQYDIKSIKSFAELAIVQKEILSKQPAVTLEEARAQVKRVNEQARARQLKSLD